MKVLVVGSGGREHAFCYKLLQSPLITKLYCAPGNAGTSSIAVNVPVSAGDTDALLLFAEKEKIEYTVVGPEIPLCMGIVDKFRHNGLKIFGPEAKAARLEGSKSFAKSFMRKYGIPTADYSEFSDYEKAAEYACRAMSCGGKVVIKADGLAAGKGVIIAEKPDEAEAALKSCFCGTFGEAGKHVVIEEFLEGEEASILAFTDGCHIIPLLPSQDHKRAGDNDTGPNTGGMGAYCPAPVAGPAVMKQVEKQVLEPFLRGIQNENFDYRGIIYAGIMITAKGIKVLEFNVRFGDPETQPVLYMLESDLLQIMLDIENRQLGKTIVKWKKGAAVCVVMAAGGYPGKYRKGDIISGLDEAKKTGVTVFHAGTSASADNVVVAGGRVLGVTASGTTIREAIDKAYCGVSKISWNNAFFRRDIGNKALIRSCTKRVRVPFRAKLTVNS